MNGENVGTGTFDAAAQLGVMSTPTILFIKNRRVVEQVTGFVGERYLAEVVETDLLGEAS